MNKELKEPSTDDMKRMVEQLEIGLSLIAQITCGKPWTDQTPGEHGPRVPRTGPRSPYFPEVSQN